MMAEFSQNNTKASSRGLLGNYRYLYKKSMQICSMENSRVWKKPHHKMIIPKSKMKRVPDESLDINKLIKKAKLSDTHPDSQSPLTSEGKSVDEMRPEPSTSELEHDCLISALRDCWEVDSGFSSETSPPVSGRSSPWLGSCPTSVVALDCEMVGTGPGGRISELARCSIVDYHGNILYDKYVKPCQPITDFRTRWSGIQRQHLQNATSFTQAREEILSILENKVVVGHSIYNDFEVLAMVHPVHLVRDTCTTRLLSRLAGFSQKRCSSLKFLSCTLLNRQIQTGRKGHCSVEDARAALDLYKLVEGEWEKELQDKLRDDGTQLEPSFTSSTHYMRDEYWPDEVNADSQ
ncbi:apoptosis-enhancing nuclease [Austrofundulus limnaeus]|uniref:Apoptosis-enhancing nuclease n=1 Tax=Austrofundulus limnaeus TaxID=52670 RepID=A0A2I4CKK7_AUSLI|nr:PREDICTED: apoptosis-enhancing nuclease-like [Austrofundulus limnaeus]